MSPAAQPAISVVFVTAQNDDATLRRMLERLAGQTVRHRMEVIIVAQEGVPVELGDPGCAGFWAVRLARCAQQALFGTALAIGVRQANAAFVALIEDHCTPDPGWAEALLARHAEGYAVVGSEISNANPDSSLSWSNFVLTHSRWAPPAVAGEVEAVAGDNCSYRCDALLEVGDELDALLESGSVLHRQLRDAGHRIFLEPRAKLVHVTPSRFTSYIGSFFHSGRLFAALWSRHWPWTRRAWHAAAAPLIALRWVADLLPAVRSQAVGQRVLPVRLLMLAAVPAISCGYLLGYLFGAGSSPRYTSDIYFRRATHIRAKDRAALESTGASGS